MAVRHSRPNPDSDQPVTPKAYGYCRVSTDQQADSGISLDEQRIKIESAAFVKHCWLTAGEWLKRGNFSHSCIGAQAAGQHL
jgi:hypothetical protein